jgi:hypothetical protein
MEEKPLSIAQVFAVTNIEIIIEDFAYNSESKFKKILEIVDENKIMEHKEIMNYIYERLFGKGYSGYADEFARNYNLR